MGEVPLNLQLDAKTMRDLDREARLQHASPDDVAQHAIARYLDAREIERRIMRERVAEADEGAFISEDAMTRWVDSWGSGEELPPPEPDVFPAGR